MAKLTSRAPRLATFRPRLSRVAASTVERDRERDQQQPWRRWYKTARWQALRWSVLVRDLFTCQRCGHVEPDTSQLVADHREPHRGDAALFWSIENLWCLCKACHDGWKARLEARGDA